MDVDEDDEPLMAYDNEVLDEAPIPPAIPPAFYPQVAAWNQAAITRVLQTQYRLDLGAPDSAVVTILRLLAVENSVDSYVILAMLTQVAFTAGHPASESAGAILIAVFNRITAATIQYTAEEVEEAFAFAMAELREWNEAGGAEPGTEDAEQLALVKLRCNQLATCSNYNKLQATPVWTLLTGVVAVLRDRACWVQCEYELQKLLDEDKWLEWYGTEDQPRLTTEIETLQEAKTFLESRMEVRGHVERIQAALVETELLVKQQHENWRLSLVQPQPLGQPGQDDITKVNLWPPQAALPPEDEEGAEDAGAASGLTLAQVPQLSVEQLQQQLKIRNLPAGGIQKDLVARLTEFLQTDANRAAAMETIDEAAADAAEDAEDVSDADEPDEADAPATANAPNVYPPPGQPTLLPREGRAAARPQNRFVDHEGDVVLIDMDPPPPVQNSKQVVDVVAAPPVASVARYLQDVGAFPATVRPSFARLRIDDRINLTRNIRSNIPLLGEPGARLYDADLNPPGGPKPIHILDDRISQPFYKVVAADNYIYHLIHYIRNCLMHKRNAARYAIVLRARPDRFTVTRPQDDIEKEPSPEDTEVMAVISMLSLDFPKVVITGIDTYGLHQREQGWGPEWIQIKDTLFDNLESGLRRKKPVGHLLWKIFVTVAHEFGHYLATKQHQPALFPGVYGTPFNLRYFRRPTPGTFGGEMGDLIEFLLFGGIFDGQEINQPLKFYSYGAISFKKGAQQPYQNYVAISAATAGALFRNAQPVTRITATNAGNLIAAGAAPPQQEGDALQELYDLIAPGVALREPRDVDEWLAGRAIQSSLDRRTVRGYRQYTTVLGSNPAGGGGGGGNVARQPQSGAPQFPVLYAPQRPRVPQSRFFRFFYPRGITWPVNVIYALVLAAAALGPKRLLAQYEEQPQPNIVSALMWWLRFAVLFATVWGCQLPLRVWLVRIFGEDLDDFWDGLPEDFSSSEEENGGGADDDEDPSSGPPGPPPQPGGAGAGEDDGIGVPGPSGTGAGRGSGIGVPGPSGTGGGRGSGGIGVPGPSGTGGGRGSGIGVPGPSGTGGGRGSGIGVPGPSGTGGGRGSGIGVPGPSGTGGGRGSGIGVPGPSGTGGGRGSGIGVPGPSGTGGGRGSGGRGSGGIGVPGPSGTGGGRGSGGRGVPGPSGTGAGRGSGGKGAGRGSGGRGAGRGSGGRGKGTPIPAIQAPDDSDEPPLLVPVLPAPEFEDAPTLEQVLAAELPTTLAGWNVYNPNLYDAASLDTETQEAVIAKLVSGAQAVTGQLPAVEAAVSDAEQDQSIASAQYQEAVVSGSFESATKFKTDEDDAIKAAQEAKEKLEELTNLRDLIFSIGDAWLKILGGEP